MSNLAKQKDTLKRMEADLVLMERKFKNNDDDGDGKIDKGGLTPKEKQQLGAMRSTIKQVKAEINKKIKEEKEAKEAAAKAEAAAKEAAAKAEKMAKEEAEKKKKEEAKKKEEEKETEQKAKKEKEKEKKEKAEAVNKEDKKAEEAKEEKETKDKKESKEETAEKGEGNSDENKEDSDKKDNVDDREDAEKEQTEEEDKAPVTTAEIKATYDMLSKYYESAQKIAKKAGKDELPPEDAMELDSLKNLIGKFNKQFNQLSADDKIEWADEKSKVDAIQRFLQRTLATDKEVMKTNKELLAIAKRAKVNIPIAIKNKKYSVKKVSAVINADIMVHACPSFDLTGTFKVDFSGLENVLGADSALTAGINHNFTNNTGKYSLGVGPLAFKVISANGYTDLSFHAEILGAMLVGVKAFVNRASCNALTLTAAGSISFTIRIPDEGEVSVHHKKGHINLGLKLNPKAAAKYKGNKELYDKTREENGGELTDKQKEELHKKITEKTKSDFVVGAEGEFTAETTTTADGDEHTNVKGKLRAYVQVGSYKKELIIEDEADAIKSFKQMIEAEHAALRLALQESLASTKPSYSSFEERKAAAIRVNSAFRAAHERYRKQASIVHIPELNKTIPLVLEGLHKNVNSVFEHTADWIRTIQGVKDAVKSNAAIKQKVDALLYEDGQAPDLGPIPGIVNVEYNYRDGKFSFDRGSISGVNDLTKMALRNGRENDSVLSLPIQINVKIDTSFSSFNKMKAVRQGRTANSNNFSLTANGDHDQSEAQYILNAFKQANLLSKLQVKRIL
ncbi:MAG: hypothetical protein GY810_15210 [Aureispira sp.]|nr:hypothetical protein [Aureispira sp.]